MKKIMFNDRYGLTEAVLSGRKTQTRMIVKRNQLFKREPDGMWTDDEKKAWEKSGISESDFQSEEDMHNAFEWLKAHAPYQVGEVVAVAQSYKDAGVVFLPEKDEEFGCHNFPAEQTAGWTNKMFVRADLMPHQIRITNVRVERLQDISDEDCEKEGIYCDIDPLESHESIWTFPNAPQWYWTSREAYTALIDKISGKGTWDSNPYVFVYDFELVK